MDKGELGEDKKKDKEHKEKYHPGFGKGLIDKKEYGQSLNKKCKGFKDDLKAMGKLKLRKADGKKIKKNKLEAATFAEFIGITDNDYEEMIRDVELGYSNKNEEKKEYGPDLKFGETEGKFCSLKEVILKNKRPFSFNTHLKRLSPSKLNGFRLQQNVTYANIILNNDENDSLKNKNIYAGEKEDVERGGGGGIEYMDNPADYKKREKKRKGEQLESSFQRPEMKKVEFGTSALTIKKSKFEKYLNKPSTSSSSNPTTVYHNEESNQWIGFY